MGAIGALALPAVAEAGGSTTVAQCKPLVPCEALTALEVGAYATPATVGEALFLACNRAFGQPSGPVRVCGNGNSSGGGNFVEPVGVSLPGMNASVYVHHGYFDRQFQAVVDLNGESVRVISRCEGVDTGTCLDPP